MHATICLREAAQAAKMPETMLVKGLLHYATERVFSPDEPDRHTWGELLVEHAEAAQEMVAPAMDEEAAPAELAEPPEEARDTLTPTVDPETLTAAASPISAWFRGKFTR